MVSIFVMRIKPILSAVLKVKFQFSIGYSVSVQLDLDKIPTNWEELVKKVGLLKRNCFAAVFNKYFDFQECGEEGHQRAVINYRNDETM